MELLVSLFNNYNNTYPLFISHISKKIDEKRKNFDQEGA